MAYIVANRAFVDTGLGKVSNSIVNYAIENDIVENVIFLVPTGKYVRKLKNEMVLKYYEKFNKPVGKLRVYTLQTLAMECFKKLPATERKLIVSDSYQLALYEEATETANLSYFAIKGSNVSTNVLKRLASITNGLIEDGITPADLKKDLENPSSDIDMPRLNDIFKLFNAYKSILGNKYTDNFDIFNRLNQYLFVRNSLKDLFTVTSSVDELFEGIQFIYLNGFTEFKPPEADFFLSFAESNIPLGIEFDYSAENGPLFSHMEYNINRFLDNGLLLFEKAVPLNDLVVRELNPSGFLRRWLFNRECESKFAGLLKNTRIIAVKDKITEVNTICRLVKYLCMNENIKPYEICIVSRQPENYAPSFREFLPLYGIPFNISQRYELSSSPVISSIFAVLNLIIKGFRMQDVRKAGRSPYLTFRAIVNGNEQIPDFVNLTEKAAKLRISGGNRRGGRDYWKQRLDKYILYLHSRISELLSDKSADPVEISNLQHELKTIRNSARDFNILSGIIPELKKRISADEFGDLLINGIASGLNILGNIQNLFELNKPCSTGNTELQRILKIEKTEMDVKALEEFIKIVEDFVFVLNDRNPGKLYKTEELASKLKTTISAQKYQVREKHKFGVTVTSVEQTRGMDYRVAILCGALDGEFPMTYVPETFLGKELPDTEKRYLQSERLQFYSFLTENREWFDSGYKSVYITYPKYSGTEELVRSPFIDELLKISDPKDNDISVFDLTEKSGSGNKYSDFSVDWIDSIATNRDIHSSACFYMKGIEIEDNIYELLKNNITYKHSFDFIEYFYNSNTKEKERFTGNVNPDYLDKTYYEALTDIKNKAFSISELEEYARCGFRYFANYLLKIKKEEDPEEFLSGMEIGNLIHYMLFRFYKEIQKEQSENDISGNIRHISGLQPVSKIILNKTDFPYYRKKLLKIAAEELDGIRFDHPFFELEEKKITGSSIGPGILEKWLTAELNKPDWQFYPVLLELSFGISMGRNKHKLNEIGPIRLEDDLLIKGKSDRIELRETDGKYQLMIADYKSNLKSVSKLNDVLKGKAFQMPLYLLAAREILGNYYDIEAVPAGVIYYSYNPEYIEKDNSYKLYDLTFHSEESGIELPGRRKAGRYSKQSINELLKHSVTFAKEITYNISVGKFMPLEKYTQDPCKFCSYSNVCRVSDNDKL